MRERLARVLTLVFILGACSPAAHTPASQDAGAASPATRANSPVDLSKDQPVLSAATEKDFEAFDSMPPQPGELVSDFALANLKGQTVSVSQFRGKQPVLVVVGSITCTVFRDLTLTNIPKVRALNASRGNRIRILIVYVKEPHPAGDTCPYTENHQWTDPENVDAGILKRQPATEEERTELARELSSRYGLPPEDIVVDDMQNTVWQQLGRTPNALYLIDRSGRLVFKELWGFKTVSPDKPTTPVVFEKLNWLLRQKTPH